MRAVIGLAVGTIIGFIFARQAFELLVKPIEDRADIVALAPTDAIFQYFKVALILGLILAMPVILYEIVSFILPGLYPHERR